MTKGLKRLKPTACIFLHWNAKGVCDSHGIVEKLPTEEIIKYCLKNDILMISAPDEKFDIWGTGTPPPPELHPEALRVTGNYPCWTDRFYKDNPFYYLVDELKGEKVLLVGGYKSLCIADAYTKLTEADIEVLINPDWIVEDPAWYAPGTSSIRVRNGLPHYWDYPLEAIYTP